jgi:hypothetical protein
MEAQAQAPEPTIEEQLLQHKRFAREVAQLCDRMEQYATRAQGELLVLGADKDLLERMLLDTCNVLYEKYSFAYVHLPEHVLRWHQPRRTQAEELRAASVRSAREYLQGLVSSRDALDKRIADAEIQLRALGAQ